MNTQLTSPWGFPHAAGASAAIALWPHFPHLSAKTAGGHRRCPQGRDGLPLNEESRAPNDRAPVPAQDRRSQKFIAARKCTDLR